MTTTPTPFTRPFPLPGPLVQGAYRLLNTARFGTEEELEKLPPPHELARPWIPATCQTNPDLYRDVMLWLTNVVEWLTHEYTWAVKGIIPACWLRHPHLVNEIAVLADQRHTAQNALESSPLEEWHRYTLPSFTDRLTTRLETSCDGRHHTPWPAAHLHTQHTDNTTRNTHHITTVTHALSRINAERQGPPEPFTPRLVPPRNEYISTPEGIVDTNTGEVIT